MRTPLAPPGPRLKCGAPKEEAVQQATPEHRTSTREIKRAIYETSTSASTRMVIKTVGREGGAAGCAVEFAPEEPAQGTANEDRRARVSPAAATVLRLRRFAPIRVHVHPDVSIPNRND